MPERLVIGLDPATKASGWAVLGGIDAGQEVIRGAGVYRAPGQDRIGRLAAIYEWALGLVDQWAPVLVAVETVYLGHNAQTTIRLAEVGAVVRLAATHAGAAVRDVSPAERKAALSLGSRASKAEVVAAVNLLFGDTAKGRPDLTDHNAADAVAIAAAGAAHLRAEALGLVGLYT